MKKACASFNLILCSSRHCNGEDLHAAPAWVRKPPPSVGETSTTTSFGKDSFQACDALTVIQALGKDGENNPPADSSLF
jgi:hypothetical protein